MKLALVQYSPIWEDKDKNISIIEKLLANSNIEADVLVFPELTLTGFTMNSLELAENIDGYSFQYFSNLALQLKKNIFAGIIEKEGQHIFNSLVHIDSNGTMKNIYRKIHLFSFVKEEKYFSSGKNIVITNIGNVKIGLTICAKK